MTSIINMSRRGFLMSGILAGGGLLLGIYMPFGRSLGAAVARPGSPFIPNAFIRVGTDGVVTIVVNRSEMGQGVCTSLPMLVAEELECDWKKIRIEPAPVDPAYNNLVFGSQGTGGSTSVWGEWDRLSKAGATAREMLIAAAAATWKVRPSSCRAEKGFVIHQKSKRKLSYGRLAAKASTMTPPKDVKLKDPKDYKLLGKPVRRLDALEKSNGNALFSIDVVLPGMLTAVIARPPVFGAKAAGFEAEQAKAVKGVRHVVEVDAGIAVVADSTWAAIKGRDALKVNWVEGEGAQISTETMRIAYSELTKTPGATARKDGDPIKVLAGAAKVLRAEYEVPYLAHAPMEPLNCVADVRPDSCEIWVGTQSQTGDRAAAAKITGLKPEQVNLHTTYLGGGFGRRGNPLSDFTGEAVQVSKAVMKPVKVIRTREDDIKSGFYRPMWFDRIAAGLDEKGNLVAWHHTIAGQSIFKSVGMEDLIKDGIDHTSVEGAYNIPYTIPNILVDLHSPVNKVPVLWWRSVGHSHTAFVVESFIDEVAYAAGKDPYEFRRALLTRHPRLRNTLDTAAEKAGWGKQLPKGRGLGIAVHESFKSIVAYVAEVEVKEEGEVRVHKVVCAVDCGMIVNPDTIAAQMESGVAFGLTAALYGEITLQNGRVQQGNFDDYRLLRIDEMPEVETHIIRNNEKPGGIGEPGVPPIAPALTNAIFAATEKRIRRLPVSAGELKKV